MVLDATVDSVQGTLNVVQANYGGELITYGLH